MKLNKCIGKKKNKVFRYEAKTIQKWKSKVQPEIKRRKFGTKETCDELSEICFFNNLHDDNRTRQAVKFDAEEYGNDLGDINLHLCEEHLPKGLLGGSSDIQTLILQRKAAKREVERFFREIDNLEKAKKTDVKNTKKKYIDAKRKEEKRVSVANEEVNYRKNILEKSKKKKKELQTELKQLEYLRGFKQRLIDNKIIDDTSSSSVSFGFGADRRVEPPENCEEVLKEYKDRIEDLRINRNDINYFIKNYIPTKKLYHVVALSCHPDKHVGEEEDKFNKIQQEVFQLNEDFLKEFDDYHEKIGQLQIIPSSAGVKDIVEYKAYPKEEGKPKEYHISPEILKQFKTPTPLPYDWKNVDLKPQGPFSPAKLGEIYVTPSPMTLKDAQKKLPDTPTLTGYETDETIPESSIRPKSPGLLGGRKRPRPPPPPQRSSSETDSKRLKISDTYDKIVFKKIFPGPAEKYLPPIIYKYLFKSDTRERYEGIVKAILRHPKKERKKLAMDNPQMIEISTINFDIKIKIVNENILLANRIIDVDNNNKNLAETEHTKIKSAYEQWKKEIFIAQQNIELEFINDIFENQLNYLEQQKWCLKYVVGDIVGDKKKPILRKFKQAGKSTYNATTSTKRKVLGDTEPVSYYKEGLVRSAINLQMLLEEIDLKETKKHGLNLTTLAETGYKPTKTKRDIQKLENPQNNPTLRLTGEPYPDSGIIVLPEISYEHPDINQRESDQMILQNNKDLVEYNIQEEKCHTDFGHDSKSIMCYGITDPISDKRLCYYVFKNFNSEQKNQLNAEIQTNIYLNKQTKLLANILFYRVVVEQKGLFNVYMITDCVDSGYKQLSDTNKIKKHIKGDCFMPNEQSIDGFLSIDSIIFSNMQLWMYYNRECKRFFINLLQALHQFHNYNYVFEPLKHTQVYYKKTLFGNFDFRFQLEKPVLQTVKKTQKYFGYKSQRSIKYMKQELKEGFLTEYLLGNTGLTENQKPEWEKFWEYMYCEANDLKHDFDKCDPKIREELISDNPKLLRILLN